MLIFRRIEQGISEYVKTIIRIEAQAIRPILQTIIAIEH